MQLGKLERIFQNIWEHDGDTREKARPYQNKFQKYSFWAMILLFILAITVAISTKFIGLFFLAETNSADVCCSFTSVSTSISAFIYI